MGDLQTHPELATSRLPCPGPCDHSWVSIKNGDSMIFHHRLHDVGAGEHPADYCSRSGTHYGTGKRIQPLFAWFPHRVGSGCEATHGLGDELVAQPGTEGYQHWPPGYLGPSRLMPAEMRSIQVPPLEPPDRAVWMRFMVPQLRRNLTGSLTDAWRVATAIWTYQRPPGSTEGLRQANEQRRRATQ